MENFDDDGIYTISCDLDEVGPFNIIEFINKEDSL
jgi:hypothetical protein